MNDILVRFAIAYVHIVLLSMGEAEIIEQLGHK